jgi:intein/homing endonuclease
MTFPINAPSAYPVFYRTYSRQTPIGRESWEEVCKRTLDGLVKLGNLTEEEAALIDEGQRSLKSLSSGRWLWVGGTPWIEQPENYYGGYNCSVSNVVDWRSFGLMMDLAMCGCGTGAVLEPRYIDQLPGIVNEMVVAVVGEIGTNPERCPDTIVTVDGTDVSIQVGDSRRGWVEAYQALLELSSRPVFNGEVFVSIDLSHVRPAGEKLQGFGGTSNPIKLPDLFGKCARILNKAVGRKLTAVECCLLIDEAALVVVAGNVRRSAGIRQFSPEDTEAATIKLGLWQQDESGQWRIDPERDALRMANHTRVFHTKPSKETILESVQQQYYSGEGAIEYAPAALVRANADVWELAPVGAHRNFLKRLFEKVYVEKGREEAKDVIRRQLIASGLPVDEAELDHRMQRYGLNPCYAPGTLIHTKDGDIPIEELVGKTVDVFDGMGWVTVDNFRITGHNQQIIKITLFNGASVRVTPGHTFYLNKELGAHLEKVEAHQLSVGDPLICWQGDPLGFTVSKIESDGYEENVYCCTVPGTHKVSLANGLIAGNCGEIVFSDNFCNLAEIHLNQIDPADTDSLDNAFRAAGLVVAVLLNHRFVEPRYQQSREWDPIVGVSFTGLFDFFVNLFGVDWLKWWEEGRPLTAKGMFFKERERDYLSHWRDVVRDAVWDYCDRHNLKRPNRYTTAQPAGSKSLLTGSSPGWHPPKAQRFIRRITFGKNDPVALACLDYGYNIVPSQSDTDENGNLLNDPFDPRCTEWLVEIPTAVPWADIPGADTVDISKFSALAQFDFYMQVQQYYVTQNTSATIEFREHEIEPLALAIHKAIENGDGYVSAALLARFDDVQTFPRLPFEPIDKATYDRLSAEVLDRRTVDSFEEALRKHDQGIVGAAGPAGCDSDKCLIGSVRPVLE